MLSVSFGLAAGTGDPYWMVRGIKKLQALVQKPTPARPPEILLPLSQYEYLFNCGGAVFLDLGVVGCVWM
jgi:hypothetical protein